MYGTQVYKLTTDLQPVLQTYVLTTDLRTIFILH